jgi:tRNA-modifying protein YgfZ
VIRRNDRSFLRVHGRDPVRMVQGLVSNDVAGAGTERAVYAAVLTPKGRMVADVRVLRNGDELLLETDTAAVAALAAHLRKFVPPLFARFEDATSAWTVVGVYGARAVETVQTAFGLNVSDSALRDASVDAVVHAEVEDTPVMVVATSHTQHPGFDIVVPASAAGEVEARLRGAGARSIGEAALETLRIEAGTPRWGTELDETTIPLEAGLRARAISETKGCYTGQEVIIRILHRGHVNWLLRGVLLGAAPPPARGAALVRDDGKQVGRITSATRSPLHAQTIALAYVRREVEPGTTLLLDGADAHVVALPFPAV